MITCSRGHAYTGSAPCPVCWPGGRKNNKNQKRAATAGIVEAALKKIGTPKKAKASAWFFKTGKGQYGYGDVFLGVTVPEQRMIAKEYQALPLNEIDRLLKHPAHECRMTALLILSRQFAAADETARTTIVHFYLAHTSRINNWDLVDGSAPNILGVYLLDKPRGILAELARSNNLWERRIAILVTLAFIRRGEYEDTFAIAKILLKDPEDLIQKAVGWMLREVGNRSRPIEEGFLKKYAAVMPRTALRYAIEKFPEKQRKAYLAMRQLPS